MHSDRNPNGFNLDGTDYAVIQDSISLNKISVIEWVRRGVFSQSMSALEDLRGCKSGTMAAMA